MPKVSIIIPVYGARDHIVACLDSVLAQTLDDVEAILVDDHGPDDSIAIARQHLESYTGNKHFRFTQTPSNGGPGAARNIGIEAATGDYVAFLDADDTLDPAFCEKLWQTAVAVNADLACCHALQHEGDATRRLTNPSFPAGPIDIATRKRILRTLVTYLWTYLFRRDFLLEQGIRFPASHSAEDSCLVCCCWLSARSAALVDKPLYHYMVAPASVSRKRDPARWKNRLASFRALVAYARGKGLYRPYRGTLRLVVFKKGWLLAARDFLTNNLF
jgi:glycosyltransferase EpsH